ncbi:hypothetical protein PtA15_11A300 [Puccinia triticina]|uniref:Uncharacterized protein n=1 Tax=Puccinia triticina TaxID=208348 RepID=A0ABY7CYA3_9BASI|nr:uncharacterized protein PtA15_11A300 [Puccinia triticina]WAQ89610.1 hypothetical protein PtA15_11A300 [Puccinia triticina]WAR59636.1 hypothetical protein PtB15_11B276 [Puccinia triticina]
MFENLHASAPSASFASFTRLSCSDARHIQPRRMKAEMKLNVFEWRISGPPPWSTDAGPQKIENKLQSVWAAAARRIPIGYSGASSTKSGLAVAYFELARHGVCQQGDKAHVAVGKRDPGWALKAIPIGVGYHRSCLQPATFVEASEPNSLADSGPATSPAGHEH